MVGRCTRGVPHGRVRCRRPRFRGKGQRDGGDAGRVVRPPRRRAGQPPSGRRARGGARFALFPDRRPQRGGGVRRAHRTAPVPETSAGRLEAHRDDVRGGCGGSGGGRGGGPAGAPRGSGGEDAERPSGHLRRHPLRLSAPSRGGGVRRFGPREPGVPVAAAPAARAGPHLRLERRRRARQGGGDGPRAEEAPRRDARRGAPAVAKNRARVREPLRGRGRRVRDARA